ncbi:uncharacterized protein LOC111247163 isoform X3 [Varroa destructor]|uniref:Uncharacterized protein n=1 Tax=Varroa destructor TaxID=109461 RepID=A0A7M7JKF0_VARDE|nr:uncharacterized protein LOC111247163 isoform X3 [Varroa destructor]
MRKKPTVTDNGGMSVRAARVVRCCRAQSADYVRRKRRIEPTWQSWCAMRSRCRLKSYPSAPSAARCVASSVLLWTISGVTVLALATLAYCPAPSSGLRTPNLPGPITPQPLPTSLLNDFIAPSSVVFPSSTPISAYINQLAQQQQQQRQFFQHSFHKPPLIRPPQALLAPHGPYFRQALQTVLPTAVTRRSLIGWNNQDPTPLNPVYRPPAQPALQPVEQLEAGQSGTIVFTQERTLSKVAPTVSPLISKELEPPLSDDRAKSSDIIPESLVGRHGGSLHNNVKPDAKPINCNDTCYKPKKEGKSLKNLENKFNRTQTCHCDHDCALFGDCCPDVLSAQSTPDWYCISATEKQNFWVKQTCRRGWRGHPNIVHECEEQEADALLKDPFRSRPVSSHVTNISYKNIMCAICNDDVENYTHWRIKLQPPEDTIYGINETDLDTLHFSHERGVWLMNNRQVVLSLSIPLEKILFAPPQCNAIVGRCLPQYNGTELEERCGSYQSVVHDPRNRLNYRNFDCALCNDVPVDNLNCGFAPPQGFYTVNARNFAFGLLLDFTGSGHVGKKLMCPGEHQEYDYFYAKCRDIFCAQPDKVYRNRECVSVNQGLIEDTSPASIDNMKSPYRNNNTSERSVFSEEFLKCPRTFLNKDEFTYLSNESIFVEKYNTTYTKVNYLPTKLGAYICLHAVNMSSNELAKFSQSMGYISAVGLGVSIACLLLHLAVFFLLPEMRNLSGKNLACLSISLLVAYLSFIAGQVDNSTAGTVFCRAIALLTYSSFLAAFFWMNSMAFDVWRTLRMATKELRVTTGPQWKRFTFYSIYSWGMTAFIVGLSIVLEHDPDFLPPEYRPAFGKYTCWFGHRKALLIFFVAPTGTIMMLNFLFFLLTALMIISSSSASASIVKDPSSSVRTNYRLYSRLAIMLGLVWSTGFFAGYLNNEVLWYIFIVLNTLQGLFIFIAFSCTKKVMWYCKERLPDFLKPSIYRLFVLPCFRSSVSSHSSSSGGGHSSGSTQHSALSRRSSPRSSVNYRHTAPYLIYGGNNKLDMY